MSQNLKVLYVEDHSDSLFVISQILSRRGYDVKTGIDVASGIEVGTHIDFDVLLCDISLPDGKGWEVLEALRKIKSFPAIAMSGYSHQSEQAEFIEHGFDRSLAKPYQPEELLAAIESVMTAHSERVGNTVLAYPA